MLASLAVAAFAGILAVVLQDTWFVWRVIATAVCTAIACGLLLGVSGLIDRVETRAAGLLGMSAVLAEFGLALLLIWEIPRRLFNLNWEDELAATMGVSAPVLLVAAILLRVRRVPPQRDAANTGLGVLAVSFAAWLVAIWAPLPAPLADHWGLTGLALLVCGGLAAVALAGATQDQGHNWRWVAAVAAALAWLVWLRMIWADITGGSHAVALSVLLGVACVVALANVLLLCPLTLGQEWLRAGTILTAAAEAGLIDLLVIRDVYFSVPLQFDLLGRLAAATGILTACGALAVLVLARINRRVDYEPRDELRAIMLFCPRCRRKQEVAVGDSTCAGCGLRIFIRIEEPRCPMCDYLLYGLVSDRCPECGTPIVATPASDDPVIQARGSTRPS